MKKRVVTISGGNGSAGILTALKPFADKLDISAVVPMTDSGGSSGRLREAFETLPPGDVLRAILGMSAYPYDLLKDIFYSARFTDAGLLTSHNLGNLFLVLAAQYGNDYVAAMRALEQAVKAVGKVYPATLESAHLTAELTDGMLLHSEAALDRPTYDRANTIQKVWLEPAVSVYPEAANILAQATEIILGPGSLHGSVIATLLPNGLKEAIAESSAKLIYVIGNKYEMNGETTEPSISSYVTRLEEYLPRPIDTVVINSNVTTVKQQAFYDTHHIGLFTRDEEKLAGKQIITEPFEEEGGGTSPQLLSPILRRILEI